MSEGLLFDFGIVDEFNWPEETLPAVLSGPPVCMCGCPESDHEKAGPTSRSSMKFRIGPGAPPAETWTLSNRYCHSPLCCCINYRPKES